MRQTYKILASIIAILVIVQAMTMVFAVAGFFHWIEEGNEATTEVFESEPEFLGSLGFMVHGMSGTMLIPLIALLLLIVSFFAKVPRGIVFALVIVVSVAVQIFAGIGAHSVPMLGILHGVNAFILFGAALAAVQAAKRATVATQAAEPAPAA